MTDANSWRQCSSCKRPLSYGQAYYRCSVSTCNRPKLELTFCSVPCWEAHVPAMRHREAWAEEARAPASAEEAAEIQASRAVRKDKPSATREASDPNGRSQKDPPMNDSGLPHEVLIVVSKLKKYIKARSGMNTSDGVVEVLSDQIRQACDAAIRRAGQADRRTVMARDFERPTENAPD